MGAARVSAGTGISVAVTSGNFEVTNTETNAANSGAITIASGETTDDITYPFTATAIENVMIQVVGQTSHETVYADVERLTTTTARITFGSALTEAVSVLVQKIG